MKISRKVVVRVAIAGAILYLFVNPGFRKLVRYEIKKRKIMAEIERLKGENARLAAEIRLLETDKSYYGQVVCRELGMLKPGEIEYRIIDKSESKK